MDTSAPDSHLIGQQPKIGKIGGPRAPPGPPRGPKIGGKIWKIGPPGPPRAHRALFMTFWKKTKKVKIPAWQGPRARAPGGV